MQATLKLVSPFKKYFLVTQPPDISTGCYPARSLSYLLLKTFLSFWKNRLANILFLGFVLQGVTFHLKGFSQLLSHTAVKNNSIFILFCLDGGPEIKG